MRKLEDRWSSVGLVVLLIYASNPLRAAYYGKTDCHVWPHLGLLYCIQRMLRMAVLGNIEELTGLDLRDSRAGLAPPQFGLFVGKVERSLSDADKHPQPAAGHHYRGGKGRGGSQSKHQGG